MTTGEGTSLSPTQQAMVELWEEHLRAEFVAQNADEALGTMTNNPYVITIPLPNGGVGREGVREYYAAHFIPQIPPDTEMVPISRTVGQDRLVDEILLRFTHTIEMDWMLPGIPPTGRRVELPLVAVIRFEQGRIAHEHIYWDQASVLAQVGLLDAESLPISGGESAQKLLALAGAETGGE